jgi:acyl carrier protein
MLNSEVVKKIHNLMNEIFSNDVITDDISDLRMGDLTGWDSLGNFNLILAIETEFDIRFSMQQITEIKSVAQIIEVLATDNV